MGPLDDQKPRNWNVLTSRWVAVMDSAGCAGEVSPLELLEHAEQWRCVAEASPLDDFAVHRFLLTLLYWKAVVAGDVEQLRAALLGGRVPAQVIDAVAQECGRFELFAGERRFLQDPTASPKAGKSAGSLFAEFPCGTGIAHFVHSDDAQSRVCVRCITRGMLRVVPWTQSGGAGLTPAVHGAPPLMLLARGASVAETLGLNLVPLEAPRGEPCWSGWFRPSNASAPIPLMEALTWNPRRIWLECSAEAGRCWMCGRRELSVVGPIVYLKNPATVKGNQGLPFQWRDPAALYIRKDGALTFVTVKSGNEASAALESDLCELRLAELGCAVLTSNPEHAGWKLVVPCTNPANNKSYDHRTVDLERVTPEAVAKAAASAAPAAPRGRDGWVEPRGIDCRGSVALVMAAVRRLTYADWVVLAGAAGRTMDQAPGAFDLLTGLWWPLRKRKGRGGLPARQVVWLVLKLMAAVPAEYRAPVCDGWCPLAGLPRRQLPQARGGKTRRSPYPRSLPHGGELETALRREIGRHLRQRRSQGIDWVRLTAALDALPA
jgi:hypothetical protein